MNNFEIKTLILKEYLEGSQIIIIDTKNEYENICKSLNGRINDCFEQNQVVKVFLDNNIVLVRTEKLIDYILQHIKKHILQKQHTYKNILLVCDDKCNVYDF